MGADLGVSVSPRFWVWASQDPNGAPLDRIQVIKGWVEDGEPHQRVRDVVCSSGRLPDADGRCPATTASVDIKSCELKGDEGAAQLHRRSPIQISPRAERFLLCSCARESHLSLDDPSC